MILYKFPSCLPAIATPTSTTGAPPSMRSKGYMPNGLEGQGARGAHNRSDRRAWGALWRAVQFLEAIWTSFFVKFEPRL